MTSVLWLRTIKRQSPFSTYHPKASPWSNLASATIRPRPARHRLAVSLLPKTRVRKRVATTITHRAGTQRMRRAAMGRVESQL